MLGKVPQQLTINSSFNHEMKIMKQFDTYILNVPAANMGNFFQKLISAPARLFDSGEYVFI